MVINAKSIIDMEITPKKVGQRKYNNLMSMVKTLLNDYKSTYNIIHWSESERNVGAIIEGENDQWCAKESTDFRQKFYTPKSFFACHRSNKHSKRLTMLQLRLPVNRLMSTTLSTVVNKGKLFRKALNTVLVLNFKLYTNFVSVYFLKLLNSVSFVSYHKNKNKTKHTLFISRWTK